MATCRFEGCEKPLYLKGERLCIGHYRQQHKGGVLRPLRSGPARVTVTLRLSPGAATVVGADRDAAVAVLEGWAASVSDSTPPSPASTQSRRKSSK